jgi:hypothetical protein
LKEAIAKGQRLQKGVYETGRDSSLGAQPAHQKGDPMKKYVAKFILLTSCLLLLSTFLFANDPAQEFSITKNPNGAWSYGFTQTLGGPFTLYPIAYANYLGVPGTDLWAVPPNVCADQRAPNLGRVQQQLFIGLVPVPSDTLYMHPGCSGQYTILRWTAPAVGTYEIRGNFAGLPLQVSTTDVHILSNGTPLFDKKVSGPGDAALFNLQQQVVAGDTVDFAVGYGSDASYYGDSMGLQLTIHLLTAIKINPCDPSNEIRTTPGTVAVAILSDASFDAPAIVDRDSLTFGRIGDERSLIQKHDRSDSRMDDFASCTPDADGDGRKDHEQSAVQRLDYWDHMEDHFCRVFDVNRDGRKDLVCLFDKELAGFQLTDTYAVLRGKTATGITIKGIAPVHIVE